MTPYYGLSNFFEKREKWRNFKENLKIDQML